jgi:hypothetical protein
MITKKEFKEKCSFHVYGNRKVKLNAIYYDWKNDLNGTGFKFMVKATTNNCSKKELFDILYDWVTKEQQPVFYVGYKYAETDQKRFKVRLTESFTY